MIHKPFNRRLTNNKVAASLSDDIFLAVFKSRKVNWGASLICYYLTTNIFNVLYKNPGIVLSTKVVNTFTDNIRNERKLYCYLAGAVHYLAIMEGSIGW